MPRDGDSYALPDDRGIGVAVDAVQPPVGVVADQRLRRLVIDGEPPPDGRRLVVAPPDQNGTVDVADVRLPWRPMPYVVLVTLLGTDSPAGQPLDKDLVRHLDEDCP